MEFDPDDEMEEEDGNGKKDSKKANPIISTAERLIWLILYELKATNSIPLKSERIFC